MDLGNYKSKNGVSIFVIAALSYILSCELLVNGSSATMENVELSKPEATVRTIQTEYGDVVDCVDIYKQKAFHHPLLNNHTLQMKPSSFPNIASMELPTLNASQSSLNIVQCPEGTVPNLRAKFSEHQRPIPLTKETQNNISVEYAQVSVDSGIYMGAEATFNLWNPKAADGDYSSAQVWLQSGETLSEKNVIQAGWMVQTPDRQTRFFIAWTRDGYQKTGCHNLQCPGFVLTTRAYFIGAQAQPISKYGGKQYEAKINIHKDKVTGNWWLRIMDQVIGYWPGVIFTSLSKNSQIIYWGGEVGPNGLTMTTEMGSGHFPSEGLGKASYIRSLGYVDSGGFIQEPSSLFEHVVHPSWYDVHVPPQSIKSFGKYFFFGGVPDFAG